MQADFEKRSDRNDSKQQALLDEMRAHVKKVIVSSGSFQVSIELTFSKRKATLKGQSTASSENALAAARMINTTCLQCDELREQLFDTCTSAVADRYLLDWIVFNDHITHQLIVRPC